MAGAGGIPLSWVILPSSMKSQAICCVLAIAAAMAIAIPLCAQPQPIPEPSVAFTFTPVDLSLLEQAELMDKSFEKAGLVYHDDALTAYITRVGTSMLPPGPPLEHVDWKFFVFRCPAPNAMALPNGSVYVNTGLLSLLENEDQLASAMAHEMSHVTYRHPYLGFRNYRKKSAVASVSTFVGNVAAPYGVSYGVASESIYLAAAMVPVAMIASMHGYNRELEQQADIYAYNRMIQGNYDPREMPKVLALLMRRDEVNLAKTHDRDHPKLDARIAYLNSLLASQPLPPASPGELAARRADFLEATEDVDREDIRLAIIAHRPRTALARAQKLVDFHPDSAANLFGLAESYRALGPWTPRPTLAELSKEGKKEARHLKRKLTPQEEEQELLSQEPGRSNWASNRKLAEENYRQALAADPNYKAASRELAQLSTEFVVLPHSKPAGIRSVAVLPPMVEVSRQGVKGGEAMGKESEQASRQFAAAVTSSLAKKGLSVESLNEDALSRNEDLKFAVADVQRRFDEISSKVFGKKKDVAKGRFTIGDAVATLNAAGTTDALVFVRAAGLNLTKAGALMTGGPIGLALVGGKTNFTTMVAVVDAKNGDVLYVGDYNTRGIPKDARFDKTFAKIPVAAHP